MKRAISILIAVVLLVVPVFASGGGLEPTVFEVNDTTEFQAALEAAQDGDVITLKQSGMFMFPESPWNKHITIQLSPEYQDYYTGALFRIGYTEDIFTIKNVTFDGKNTSSPCLMFAEQKISFENCRFQNFNITKSDTALIQTVSGSTNLCFDNCDFSYIVSNDTVIRINTNSSCAVENCEFKDIYSQSYGILHNAGSLVVGANRYGNIQSGTNEMIYSCGSITLDNKLENYVQYYGFEPKGWEKISPYQWSDEQDQVLPALISCENEMCSFNFIVGDPPQQDEPGNNVENEENNNFEDGKQGDNAQNQQNNTNNTDNQPENAVTTPSPAPAPAVTNSPEPELMPSPTPAPSVAPTPTPTAAPTATPTPIIPQTPSPTPFIPLEQLQEPESTLTPSPTVTPAPILPSTPAPTPEPVNTANPQNPEATANPRNNPHSNTGNTNSNTHEGTSSVIPSSRPSAHVTATSNPNNDGAAIPPEVSIAPEENSQKSNESEANRTKKPTLVCNGAIIDTSRTVVLHGWGGSLHESEPLTRAQLATIIYRLLDDESIALYGNKPSSFADVLPNAWYTPYVQLIHSAGIVNGVGGGRYDPEGLVTWAHTLTIMSRFVEPQEYTIHNIQYDGWANQAIQTAVALGWIEDSENFDPDAVVERGELVVFINEILGSYSGA